MKLVISGVGVVTAYGLGLEALHRGLLSGTRPFSSWQTPWPRAAELRSLMVAPVAMALASQHSRSTELALVAAAEPLFGLSASDRVDLAIIVGGTTGGMAATEACFLGAQKLGVDDFTLEVAGGHAVAETADALAAFARASGPRTTLVSACSSGLNSLILGQRWIEQGWAKRVLAVGTDALCHLTLAGFSSLGAIDPEGTKPFQSGRRGLTLGEGAAAFLLEPLSEAHRGGRPILAEVSGSAICGEAFHQTQPDPSGAGALRVMDLALQDAGLTSHDIDAISAHGTGTIQNDAMECLAVATRFGQRPLFSSQKSQLGHALGAAGALELAACVAMLQKQVVYPTFGLTDQNLDPACAAVRQVFTEPVLRPLRYVLKNSFAFGGQNAAVILGRGEP